MLNQSPCPFCNLEKSKVILTNYHARAIYDGYPVTPFHSLIVSKRHIPLFFEATREEQAALFDLLAGRKPEKTIGPTPVTGLTFIHPLALINLVK